MTTTSLRLSTSFEATNQQLFSIFFNQTLFDTNSHFTHSFSKLFLTMCHENHKTNTKKTRKIRNKMSTRQGYQHKNEQKQIKGHEITKTRNNKATTKTHEKLQPWREHAKTPRKSTCLALSTCSDRAILSPSRCLSPFRPFSRRFPLVHTSLSLQFSCVIYGCWGMCLSILEQSCFYLFAFGVFLYLFCCGPGWPCSVTIHCLKLLC